MVQLYRIAILGATIFTIYSIVEILLIILYLKHPSPNFLSIVFLSLNSVNVIAYILLLVGAIKKCSYLLLPWLMNAAILFIFLCFISLYTIQDRRFEQGYGLYDYQLILLLVMTAAFLVFTWYLIYLLYGKIKARNQDKQAEMVILKQHPELIPPEQQQQQPELAIREQQPALVLLE